MPARPSVTFVIMAGGKGERLWPLVRWDTPKVCLSPDGKRTLLQATIDRLRPVWPGADWLIVTTDEQADAIRRCLPPTLQRAILVEPQVKNTAACITLAAMALASRDPHSIMVAVPADHWIDPPLGFQRTMRLAIETALKRDTIATIGIRPTHPHPGLGYLCAGPVIGESGAGRVLQLAQFIEKPSEVLAQRLLRHSGVYWNSGMFVGTADKFLECVTEWLPDHTKRLLPLVKNLRRPDYARARAPVLVANMRRFVRRAGRAYRMLEAVSFDHGVMDHLRGGVIVEAQFSWADLGSWDVWARLGRASSSTVAVDSQNVTVVGSGGHLIAAVGVQNLLVVHTPSATLICHPSRVQKVRDVVKRITADRQLSKFR